MANVKRTIFSALVLLMAVACGSSSDEYLPTNQARQDYLDTIAWNDPTWASALNGSDAAGVEEMLIRSGIDACTWYSEGRSAEALDLDFRRDSGVGADVSVSMAAAASLCPEFADAAFPND